MSVDGHLTGSMMEFFMRFLFLAIVVGLVCGCGQTGPELGQVVGVVTYEGEPLADARVVFKPEQGRTSAAMTDAEGKYQLLYTPNRPGALIGGHSVSITWEPQDLPEPDQEGYVRPSKREIIIPRSYNTQSKLTADVKPELNEVNFTLHADGS